MSRTGKTHNGETAVIREMTVTDPTGFHCQPAAQIAKIALNFEGEISVEKDGVTVTAKSVMGMLGLLAVPDKRVKFRVRAEGRRATEAVDNIEKIVRGEFDAKAAAQALPEKPKPAGGLGHRLASLLSKGKK